MPMTPALRQWLTAYHEAMDEHDSWERDWDPARLPSPRPLAAQFTITADCDLLDAHGRLIANIADLDPYTLNLGRNPMPRRNPDSQALRNPPRMQGANPAAVIMDEAARPDECDCSGDALGGHRGDCPARVYYDPATGTIRDAPLMAEPSRSLTEVLESGALDHLLNTPNLGEPGTSVHETLERMGVNLDGIPDGAIQPVTTDPVLTNIAANLSANMGTTFQRAAEAMSSAMASLTPPAAPEPPVYVGPRMLATISVEPGSADRYTGYTGTTDLVLERLRTTFHGSSIMGTMARRCAEDAPTAATVDRNAAAVNRMMIRAFGIEFNEETLTAVTAAVTYTARQATFRSVSRAAAAETDRDSQRARADEATERLADVRRTLATVRQERDSLRATLTLPREAPAPDPGTVEAAAAAARAWKAAPVSDSVGKRDAFLHLLDTLEGLAR